MSIDPVVRSRCVKSIIGLACVFVAAWAIQIWVLDLRDAEGIPKKLIHHQSVTLEPQDPVKLPSLSSVASKIASPQHGSPSNGNSIPSTQNQPATSAENQVGGDFVANRPLDRLDVLETIAEDWPEGAPTARGWYQRVRIVDTSFKCRWIRIEERVEVDVTGSVIRPIRSIIEKAMDARHVLVSSQGAAKLAAHGVTTESGRNPNYVKVVVNEPQLTSSIPLLFDQLKNIKVGGAEPDAIIEGCAQASDPLVGDGLAWHLDNVGLLPGQHAHSDINATTAWDKRTDASSVLVAVIDSGIAASDPELAPSIHSLYGEALGDHIDNDGNGYIDDSLGYDFYHDDPDPDDEAGHGSACAALVGAVGNNGIGSSGVAWKASILNCKFLDRNGLGVLSDAIDAIDYARGAHAKILNLSWSYNGDAPLLTEALARCDAENILMVCASGNAGFVSPVPAPASISLPHLVAVAASTPSDTLASFSVVDPVKVHLAAPGVNLPIALSYHPWSPGVDVEYATGTSFSAAVVSGALALAVAEFPLESTQNIIRRMLETVDPLPGGAGTLSSGGRLNLGRMLGTASPLVPNDSFAQRRIVIDSSGQWTGRNDGAGIESIDGTLGLSPAPQRSLWFDWTAPSSGLLRITAKAKDVTSVSLAVFSNVDSLPSALLAKSADSQARRFQVVSE